MGLLGWPCGTARELVMSFPHPVPARFLRVAMAVPTRQCGVNSSLSGSL